MSSNHHDGSSKATTTGATITTTTTTKQQQKQQQQHSSKRYQRLLIAIDKCLAESRRAIDTAACIKETYREDASIFQSTADSDLLLLNNVFDSMIERVQDAVKEGTIQAMEREHVPERLQLVDDICQRLERDYQTKLELDRRDRQQTRQVLEQHTNVLVSSSSGSSNVPTSEDVVLYHAFQERQREKENLLRQVAEMTSQTEDLKRRHAEMKRQIQESMQAMEFGLGKEVQQGWDMMCSSVSEREE